MTTYSTDLADRYLETPYPERKYIGLAFAIFMVYYVTTRFIFAQKQLGEPFDTLFSLSFSFLVHFAGWKVIARKGFSPYWRIVICLPIVGFIAAIIFLVLPARNHYLLAEKAISGQRNLE